ncbi:MAG: DUF2089 domain-containing protein [Clostridia bacterium]|nr:DUF2089 domain-containing protein [Clostridia bacterium]
MLKDYELPNWLINLETEDLNFVKQFILNSGSLKDMARRYDVTYPTIRTRLDRLINKIELYDKQDTDSYIESVKSLAIDGKIDIEVAKTLISEYKKVKYNGN